MVKQWQQRLPILCAVVTLALLYVAFAVWHELGVDERMEMAAAVAASGGALAAAALGANRRLTAGLLGATFVLTFWALDSNTPRVVAGAVAGLSFLLSVLLLSEERQLSD